jgi:hypothetical protein
VETLIILVRIRKYLEFWVTDSTGSSFNSHFLSCLLILLARKLIKAINIFTVMISLFNFIEIMFTSEIPVTHLDESWIHHLCLSSFVLGTLGTHHFLF